MRHLESILKSYRNGDRLPDDELAALRENMEHLADLCCQFGEMFTLPGNYARNVASNCREFQRHRDDGAKRDADRAAFAEAMNSI